MKVVVWSICFTDELFTILKVYRDLCLKHKTFRERSENADIATEIR